jgi:hypothetical protein
MTISVDGRRYGRGVRRQVSRWFGAILRTGQVDGDPFDALTIELGGEFLPTPRPAPAAVN